MKKSQTIVFIHGLFMNPKSWRDWVKYFEAKGYQCHTPAYPFHEGEPGTLRQNINPRLGKLKLGEVAEPLAKFIDTLPEKPILIGHSMGGLLVQKLISIDKGAMGVCIDTAAPAGVVVLKWSFLKSNLPVINPLKGDSVFKPSVDWFHYAFCHTLPLDETQKIFDDLVVPESRNIPRTSSKADGKIDLKKPHEPLLFIAGELDRIIPSALNRKNFEAYKDEGSIRDFKEFQGRTHFIVGQDNWEEVAGFVANWIDKQ
jgi:pimeloyl-ACP methyl ester carboxylesterase